MQKLTALLTLHYIPEDEWHGELRVEARHAGFLGKSSAWLNADALQQFAVLLKTWPPIFEEPVTLQGGYFSDSTTSSALVETHAGISIAQIGTKGRCRAEATLAEPDDEILPQSATIRFVVEPCALVRFAGQINAMLANGGSAHLPASSRAAY